MVDSPPSRQPIAQTLELAVFFSSPVQIAGEHTEIGIAQQQYDHRIKIGSDAVIEDACQKQQKQNLKDLSRNGKNIQEQ